MGDSIYLLVAGLLTGFIPDRENRENEKCRGNVRELFYFPNVREMSGNFF